MTANPSEPARSAPGSRPAAVAATGPTTQAAQATPTVPTAPGWRRGPRLWPWALLLVTLATLLLAAALVAELNELLRAGAPGGWQLVVDDQRVFTHDFSAGDVLVAVAVALLAGVLLLLIVPLAVGVAVLAAALGLAIALLAVLGVVAVALSPVWLVVGVLWLALRRPAPAASSAA
jgi:hypothetical protein